MGLYDTDLGRSQPWSSASSKGRHLICIHVLAPLYIFIETDKNIPKVREFKYRNTSIGSDMNMIDIITDIC